MEITDQRVLNPDPENREYNRHPVHEIRVESDAALVQGLAAALTPLKKM